MTIAKAKPSRGSEIHHPIFCKDCGSKYSWQRKPSGDIKSESGKVLWNKWVCHCGAETITPTKELLRG